MMIDDPLKQQLLGRLRHLYGDWADACLPELLALVEKYASKLPPQKTAWDESDVVLITYGDQVGQPDGPALGALGQLLDSAGLKDRISDVHILPFFPYSSDDGFSVIDYRQVDPAVGGWADVTALGRQYRLMFDLVLNHCSRQSSWFFDYAAGREPFTQFFIEMDPASDLSMVTRPRSLPLLSPVETSAGTRYLWTTFSDDQLDLNFAEPVVLFEMLDVLLFYLKQGARIVRLDAIAYLWKEPGTSCIHRPQTHTVVKLMRDLVDALSPGAILLTETNVPHEENVSYFGDGDEAQMVYQFSLAPLLLEALLSGDASLLVGWLRDLEPPPPGCTVFNFTASHDGIGVRPLEGIMPPERFERLIEAVKARGGRVSTKRNADGTDSPYEMNITYFSAMADPEAGGEPDALARQVRRFLASQALMLSLRGIPGIYFHSLVGTSNDLAGVERTGRARSINRRKFDLAEIQQILDGSESTEAMVLDGYRRLLAARIAQPAFHPDAPQELVLLDDPALVGFRRTSLDGSQSVFVLANVGAESRRVDVRAIAGGAPREDLISGGAVGDSMELAPYQVAWLRA